MYGKNGQPSVPNVQVTESTELLSCLQQTHKSSSAMAERPCGAWSRF